MDDENKRLALLSQSVVLALTGRIMLIALLIRGNIKKKSKLGATLVQAEAPFISWDIPFKSDLYVGYDMAQAIE